jgi:TatD DNase family protein
LSLVIGREFRASVIDTHCHLTDPRLFEQVDAVMQRARAAGVDQIVTIGTHTADWDAAIGVAAKYPNVKCAVGAHPNEAHKVDREQLSFLRGYCANPVVVALGEMGLDYHYGSEHRARQKEFFEIQLELARELALPVVIHCREAADDCLAIMSGFSDVRAVFHCFTGSMDEARRIWDAGYLTGFTGVITFKNGDGLREIVKAAPAERILIETDAPYLTPEPMRKQKINEPAMVVHTAAMVAKVRGVTLEELDAQATKNAISFYRWDRSK